MGVLKNPVLIRLSRWLEAYLYKRATHLLVNSPAYTDYLIACGVPATKVTLIPNGVDCSMFDPDHRGEAVRKQFGLCDRYVVTYAGALGLANDLGTLLAAAERLKDDDSIHFLLLGDGKEKDNLVRQAKARDLRNVTFAGARPKLEMPAILAASDACIAILQDIPEFRTTYPNKVFDYMAAGRPTILAIDGVIRQVVEAAGAGVFVPPGHAAALAEAVRSLSQDREGAAAMGRAAREYVEKHFKRSDHARAFEELVAGLAVGH
jgi:glycosyltransferase involved in cell wall biosynthesis